MEINAFFVLQTPTVSLKALNTFSNCQRPISSLCPNAHNNTSVKNWSIGRQSCKRIMKEQTPLLHNYVCAFRCLKRLQMYFKIWVRNYLLFKSYLTSEGAVSHNVLYFQQPSFARYKVITSANFIKLLSRTY